jgi:glycosyltransferase involved in cell wall biosynthesis
VKILLTTDVSIDKVIGGAERVLFEQSTRLARRGHDVHILTRQLKRHKKTNAVIQGVKEWRYDVDSHKNAFSFLISTYRNSRKLFESLHKKYSIDLINFYQPFSGFGVIQSPLSRRIRKIYTCFSFSFEEFISRNIQPDLLVRRYIYLLNTHLRKWIEKKVLKSCDEIVVLSQFTQDKLWNAYKITHQNVPIIPAGIDLKKFQPASDKLLIRSQVSIPSEKVILFTVRNLVPRMGLENLIRALKKVVQKAPDIYLVLGGDGPLKVDLIDLATNLELEDFIGFVGFIPEERLPDYYGMADLFVLPTIELEGFGLVTLEAMASGLPVVGTPIGGTKEILGNFDSGFLFKGTDSNSIAEHILENYYLIKQNPKKWKEISQQCRKFVERNYSWEKNIDSLEELFEKTLQN